MRKFLVIIGIFTCVLLFIGIWWQRGLGPVDRQDTKIQIFVVKKGESLREVANNLKKMGFIKDQIVFFLLAKQTGIDRKIQAGDFRLAPSMDLGKIASSLTTGSVDIWVTIPEGKRADEIADILKEKIPTYDETWREELNKHEGYLFPDTYLLPKDASIEMVTSLLKNTFAQKYALVENNTKRTPEEIVIIASLIEREARHDEDRALVSSVIHNRLNIGMKLDLDATIQYALGYQPSEGDWWKKALTIQDIRLNVPYNTYRNPGLPPGPIANPGLKSLQAAANPARTNYLFYIADKNGINRYGRTIEEHNANISKYGL